MANEMNTEEAKAVILNKAHADAVMKAVKSGEKEDWDEAARISDLARDTRINAASRLSSLSSETKTKDAEGGQALMCECGHHSGDHSFPDQDGTGRTCGAGCGCIEYTPAAPASSPAAQNEDLVECKTCSGDGKVYDGYGDIECPNCGGSGTIKSSTPAAPPSPKNQDMQGGKLSVKQIERLDGSMTEQRKHDLEDLKREREVKLAASIQDIEAQMKALRLPIEKDEVEQFQGDAIDRITKAKNYDFLRDNGCIVVGGDVQIFKGEKLDSEIDRVAMMKRQMAAMKSNVQQQKGTPNG